jgi:hypothetical protein
MAAQLPNQDVSSDDQIHLGATRTQILCLIIHTLWTCFTHAPSLYNRTQNLGLGIIYHFLKKMNWAKGRQEEKDAHSCTVCNKDPLLT